MAHPPWLLEEEVEIPVQVNGKVRSRVTVLADAHAAAIEPAARADAKLLALVHGVTVRKVVAVPGRMVNFVVS